MLIRSGSTEEAHVPKRNLLWPSVEGGSAVMVSAGMWLLWAPGAGLVMLGLFGLWAARKAAQ